MALTTEETLRLAEVTVEITQLENRLNVSHALGDNHSAQGISTSFSNNPEWRNRLTLLRSVRNRLNAIDAGTPLPPPPGVNLSFYSPADSLSAP